MSRAGRLLTEGRDMYECGYDECGEEYVVDDSDAEFPSVYCSSTCQIAADAESMGVTV